MNRMSSALRALARDLDVPPTFLDFDTPALGMPEEWAERTRAISRKADAIRMLAGEAETRIVPYRELELVLDGHRVRDDLLDEIVAADVAQERGRPG